MNVIYSLNCCVLYENQSGIQNINKTTNKKHKTKQREEKKNGSKLLVFRVYEISTFELVDICFLCETDIERSREIVCETERKRKIDSVCFMCVL